MLQGIGTPRLHLEWRIALRLAQVVRVPALMVLFAQLLVIPAAPAGAAPPVFYPPVFVESSGDRIDVGSHSSPCVTDWDGDGLKDLICFLLILLICRRQSEIRVRLHLLLHLYKDFTCD